MRRSRRRWLLGAALGLALAGSGCTPSGPRSFTLSRDLDTAAIQAKLDQGVLELRIPKHQQTQPKRITVQAG